MAKPLEKSFQKNVKKYLLEQGAYVVNYVAQSVYGTNGIPDLLVCYKGRFIGLELKVPPYKPTPIQLANLKKIEKAGGIGKVFAHSVNWKEELKELLKEI